MIVWQGEQVQIAELCVVRDKRTVLVNGELKNDGIESSLHTYISSMDNIEPSGCE
jgi:hypothetical protein